MTYSIHRKFHNYYYVRALFSILHQKLSVISTSTIATYCQSELLMIPTVFLVSVLSSETRFSATQAWQSTPSPDLVHHSITSFTITSYQIYLWQFFMQLTQLCALWASARAIQNRRTITAVYIVATKHTITAREYANNDQVNSNITLEHHQCTHNIWPILHKAWFSYINVTITCGICGVWPLSLWLFWTYCNLWVVDL